MDNKKTKETTKNYAIGVSWTTLFIALIGTLVGYIITGTWQGALVGLIMVLATAVIVYAGVVPFIGAFWLYPLVYNAFMDWFLGVTGMTETFAFPRLLLFWGYGILAALATIITSVAVVLIIIAGIAYLTD